MRDDTDGTADLRDVLLSRLRAAWDTGGNGSMPAVRDAYVQWAKFPEGLQIECASNAFLPSGAPIL